MIKFPRNCRYHPGGALGWRVLWPWRGRFFKRAWQRGISWTQGALLIEVLLTIAILAGSLTVVIHSFVRVLRANVHSVDYSTATLLAENQMTQYFQMGAIKDGIDESHPFEEPYEKFHYRLVTKNKSDGGEKGFLNEVQFVVTWTTGQSEHSLTVVSFLPNEVL